MESPNTSGKRQQSRLLTYDELKALNIRTTELLIRHKSEFAQRQYLARHGSLDATKPAAWYIEQLKAVACELCHSRKIG